MLMRVFLLVGLCLGLISGCSQQPQTVNWPSDLPPKAIFERSYDEDIANQAHQSKTHYLTWVRRFFYGTPLQPKGWLEMSQELQAHVQEQEKDYLAGLVSDLGVKIAAEWAKNNKVRRVNTKNMIVWGSALRESIVANEVIPLVEGIDRDVDALLGGSIKTADITSDRYFEMEYNEFF